MSAYRVVYNRGEVIPLVAKKEEEKKEEEKEKKEEKEEEKNEKEQEKEKNEKDQEKDKNEKNQEKEKDSILILNAEPKHQDIPSIINSKYIDKVLNIQDEKMKNIAVEGKGEEKNNPVIQHLDPKYHHIKFDYKFVINGNKGEFHPLKYQKLDYSKYERRFKGLLPSSVSLSKYLPEVPYQGKIGACVSHSFSSGLYILMNQRYSTKWGISKLLTSSEARPFFGSRLFLYDNARRVDGTPLSDDIGCTNLSASIALTKYKICKEPLWPYVEENVYQQPYHECYIEASKFTKFKYSVLDQTAEDVKYALASGHPVACGVLVHKSFIEAGDGGRRAIVPYPHPREPLLGGHSILLTDYDDSVKRFTFANWWEGWSDDSFGHIGYDYVEDQNIAGDLIAIEEFY